MLFPDLANKIVREVRRLIKENIIIDILFLLIYNTIIKIIYYILRKEAKQ